MDRGGHLQMRLMVRKLVMNSSLVASFRFRLWLTRSGSFSLTLTGYLLPTLTEG